jgi:ZIP family zinc transporter
VTSKVYWGNIKNKDLTLPALSRPLVCAAGAMIFVVVEELILESRQEKHSDIATSDSLIGFTAMMILDVALG